MHSVLGTYLCYDGFPQRRYNLETLQASRDQGRSVD